MPLDFNAEIEKHAELYRSFRTNSTRSWKERDLEVEGAWEAAETNLLEDVGPLLKALEAESLPLSRQAAERVLPLYLQITNPVGRIFGCSFSRYMEGDLRVFEFRTEREAARAILASLIYERRKGHLPTSLSELVDEGILESVPTDFFSDLPISYSRKRRLVWSVGLDGTDDKGDGDPDHRWTGKDTVWRIPELKK